MSRLAISLLLCLASLGHAGRAEPSISITGDVAKPMQFNMDSLAKFKTVQVKLHDHDGLEITYEGPLVADVLKEAGISAGEHPGKAVATYVAAVASDGYEVVFGLGELTPAISGRNIILAYKANGKPLAENIGPLRVVIEGDKVQARCIRMVTELKVGQLRK